MYGLLALLSVGATYAFLANLKKPTVWRTVVYFLLITAIIYTQYIGILILVAHKLILLWDMRREKQPQGLRQWLREAWTAFRHRYRWYTYSVIGMGVAFLPWLPKLRHQFGDVQNGFWLQHICQASARRKTDSILSSITSMLKRPSARSRPAAPICAASAG